MEKKHKKDFYIKNLQKDFSHLFAADEFAFIFTKSDNSEFLVSKKKYSVKISCLFYKKYTGLNRF